MKEHLADSTIPASTSTPRATTTDTPCVHTLSQPSVFKRSEEEISSPPKVPVSALLTEALRKVGEEAATQAKVNKREPARNTRSSVSEPAISEVDEMLQEAGVPSMSPDYRKFESSKDL